MNDFSLYENFEIEKPFDDIHCLTNTACLINSESGLRWKQINGEQSSRINLTPEAQYNCISGEFVVLLSGSKLNFFPSNHTNALYDIDILPRDLAAAKKIKIVCKKLPQVSATVALLTDGKLVTYIYDESDETTRLEIEADKINDFAFVNQDYIYGWGEKQIIRYRVTKKAIFIYRKLPNMTGSSIINLVAMDKFIICQTREHLCWICNSTGCPLQKQLEPDLISIHLGAFNDKILGLLVYCTKIDIIEFSMEGRPERLVWSQSGLSISKAEVGSNALVYQSGKKLFWLPRLSPESKLERLVKRGDLSLAAEFAKKYELDSQIINETELRQLVMQGTNFDRIEKLVKQCPNVEFIIGLASETTNPLISQALYEIASDMEENLDIDAQLALDELVITKTDNAKSMEEVMRLLKAGDFDGLVRIIHEHATDLTERIVEHILKQIPNSASSEQLIRFAQGIMSLLLRALPAMARNQLPMWIAERALHFQETQQASWPQNAIDLVECYLARSNTSFQSISDYKGTEVALLNSLERLCRELKEIKLFKEKFDLDVPVSILIDHKKKESWIKTTIKERLRKARNRKDCERVVQKLLLPLLVEIGVNRDEYLTEYIADHPDCPLESRLELIKNISTVERQRKELVGILQALPYPWPTHVREFANSLA